MLFTYFTTVSCLALAGPSNFLVAGGTNLNASKGSTSGRTPSQTAPARLGIAWDSDEEDKFLKVSLVPQTPQVPICPNVTSDEGVGNDHVDKKSAWVFKITIYICDVKQFARVRRLDLLKFFCCKFDEI